MEMLKKEEEILSAIKEKQELEGYTEISQAVLDERAKTVEDWHRNAAARARYTNAAAPITCATFAQDVLEGRAKVSQAHDHKHQPMFGPASLVGGTITSERERIAAQVFQPGHRLPTMSIEEAGLKEMEMMNKWQENTAKMIEAANSSWHNDKWKPRAGGGDDDEEEDEDDDAAQEKARAFDDWKMKTLEVRETQSSHLVARYNFHCLLLKLKRLQIVGVSCHGDEHIMTLDTI